MTGASASTISANDRQTPGTFLNEINSESLAGANFTNNQQGWGDNVNNLSTLDATGSHVGINVATGATSSKVAEEDFQTPGTLLNKINRESLSGENIAPNGGSNVEQAQQLRKMAIHQAHGNTLHILSIV